MKKISLLFTAFILTATLFAQVDKNGNPVFNSELISEEKFELFELSSSYYTINNNINNKASSVYVSDQPTVEAYITFARNLPATFFIVHKGEKVICMIMLLQKNDNGKTSLTYNLYGPNSKNAIEVPCNVWGEINEKRAQELLKLHVDTAAAIIELPNNGKGLLFNGITYSIQPYEKLKTEILAIADQITGSKQEQGGNSIEAFIKKESVAGGKLDFYTTLADEKGLLYHDGIAYSKKRFCYLSVGSSPEKTGH